MIQKKVNAKRRDMGYTEGKKIIKKANKNVLKVVIIINRPGLAVG